MLHLAETTVENASETSKTDWVLSPTWGKVGEARHKSFECSEPIHRVGEGLGAIGEDFSWLKSEFRKFSFCHFYQL